MYNLSYKVIMHLCRNRVSCQPNTNVEGKPGILHFCNKPVYFLNFWYARSKYNCFCWHVWYYIYIENSGKEEGVRE